jgi:hypothetical protein
MYIMYDDLLFYCEKISHLYTYIYSKTDDWLIIHELHYKLNNYRIPFYMYQTSKYLLKVIGFTTQFLHTLNLLSV